MIEGLIAVGIGIAFGWSLERAGLGSARKLSGQFYFTDFTVFKVMFTAIVVAMLGAFWLARAGLLDLARVSVPDTYVLPQLAGGVIFGIGFAVAGLCPGTSCVAAATGRGDGAAVMAGLFTGILVTGLLFASLRPFYESTARGPLTLPQLLHVPYGVVICAIVGVALAGFALTGRPSLPAVATIATASVLTLFVTLPKTIEPLELAAWIRNHKAGVHIEDSRPLSDFTTNHIPGAVHIAAEGGGAPQITVKSADAVFVLRGGMQGWVDDVLNPTLPANGSAAEFQRVSALSRYFGGVPRIGPMKASTTASAVRRRGC